MSDIKEVYEMVTKQKPPQPGALERQFNRQRRAARNRRLGAFAVAAAFVVAVGVIAIASRPNTGITPASPTGSPLIAPPLNRAIVYDGLRSIEADGSGSTQLPRGTSPAWSSDGSKIVFVGPRDELSVMGADGSSASVVGRFDGVSYPTWSPDGHEILFSALSGGVSQLFVVHPDGTGLQQLTHVPTPNGNGPNFASWSPGGEQIAFSMRRSPSNTTMDIFVMNADGTHIRDLTGQEASGIDRAAPQWSPDGGRIVYTVATTPTNKDIYTMAADGSDQRPLVTMVGQEPHPHWSPDGTWIVFTADAGSSDAHLEIVDRNGQNGRSIDAGPDPLYPAW